MPSDVVRLLAAALRSGSDRPPGGLTRAELVEKLSAELGNRPSADALVRTLRELQKAGKLKVVYGSERRDGRAKRQAWYVAVETPS